MSVTGGVVSATQTANLPYRQIKIGKPVWAGTKAGLPVYTPTRTRVL
jgi:hypothetical protein